MTTPTYEQATARLEEIAAGLSRLDVSIDSALSLFQEGIGLLRQASGALQGAEAQLEQLVEEASGALVTVPLPNPKS